MTIKFRSPYGSGKIEIKDPNNAKVLLKVLKALKKMGASLS